MVGGRNLIYVDVEVDALPAGTLPYLDVGEFLSLSLNFSEGIVVDPDALGVSSNGIEVEAEPSATPFLPIPARGPDTIGMEFKGPLQLVVLELGLIHSTFGNPKVPPFVQTIGPGGTLPVNGLAVPGSHVHLCFTVHAVFEVSIKQIFSGMVVSSSLEKVDDGFTDELLRHLD
jgi:hypothetical protein